MRGLIDAIRAALAALADMVWKVVKVGGRMMLMLVPGPRKAPQGVPASTGPAVDEGYDLDAVRDAAGRLAQGLELPVDCQLTGQQQRWLATLSRLQLCRLLTASDRALRGHLDGSSVMDKVRPMPASTPAAHRIGYQRRLAAYKRQNMQRHAAPAAAGMQRL